MNCRFWLILVSTLGLLAGCASPLGNEAADLSEQDSAAAVRIKGSLIQQLEMAGTAIDVQVENGRALLGGFVETAAERERAAEIARRHQAVTEVVNEIVVKE